MSEKEYITPEQELQKYHLYIHWCAKEALYKICDKKDIIFKENLFIENFEPMEKGRIKGLVDTIHTTETFILNYEKFKNYVIVWTVK
jgi:hypothetical protein